MTKRCGSGKIYRIYTEREKKTPAFFENNEGDVIGYLRTTNESNEIARPRTNTNTWMMSRLMGEVRCEKGESGSGYVKASNFSVLLQSII